ncbi:MAG TPA: HEAT repeat domain-containing protein [Armatimonadota bacterium]|nr:HEAT repeat domain-containing protein [Armatimonadota bacterium]
MKPGRGARAAVMLCAVALLLQGCTARKAQLTAEEQRAWDNFIAKQLDQGMVQPTSQDADAVAAIGDKIVPYMEENLGKAYRGAGGKGDYWLVIVLARIGTPRAADAIEKVLKHDYDGKTQLDREIAASALVWLGAKDAAPALKDAIADQEQLIRERSKGDPTKAARFGWDEALANLKASLQQLEQGIGARSTKNFPFS